MRRRLKGHMSDYRLPPPSKHPAVAITALVVVTIVAALNVGLVTARWLQHRQSRCERVPVGFAHSSVRAEARPRIPRLLSHLSLRS